MKRIIRKTSSHVHVTYKNGGFTNNLNAENFAIEAEDARVICSMDFSGNERTRHKDSNSYLDARELQENSSNVAFFQIFEESLMREIRAAVMTHKDAAWTVEIRFKDGKSHSYPVSLEGDNSIVQMNMLQ